MAGWLSLALFSMHDYDVVAVAPAADCQQCWPVSVSISTSAYHVDSCDTDWELGRVMNGSKSACCNQLV